MHGTFDLTALAGRDYHVKGLQDQDIVLSFCGPVSTSVWAVDHPETVGAYYESSHGGVSLGQVSSEPTMSKDGILSLKYLEGSRCPNSNARRASVIQLQCDQSWSNGAGRLKLVNAIDECAYFFTIESPHACPVSLTASVLGSLSVFVTFVLVALLVSFGSTIAYNRLVLGRRGADQLPTFNKVRDNLGSVQAVATVIGIALLDVGQMIGDQLKSLRASRMTHHGGTRWQPTNVDYASWWANREQSNSMSTAASTGDEHDSVQTGLSETTDDAFRIGDDMLDRKDRADDASAHANLQVQARGPSSENKV
ncbi:hypothetical protein OIV83_001688 [Microbotryomycetes sp. JL201]|nr:hypothetical protein OIV83_001688 [Microbotryomycetes sp. JL201]